MRPGVRKPSAAWSSSGSRQRGNNLSAVAVAIWGGVGAAFGWILLEFVGKPFRAFLDLKRESLETLTLYANVRARTKEIRLLNDDGLMSRSSPQKLGTAEEQRLRQAEEAFRLCGSRFDAFARTERFAVFALHLLRFRPEDAGRGFIGLSNSIGEYGQTRHENRQLVERSLKAMD
jgi:hypothetical protein